MLEDAADALDEARRVCGGELFVLAPNRLGYKRSSGRRGDFRVPGPLEYARAALGPSDERTLPGWRRRIAARGFERPRAFALYPHAADFSHVVALDAERPRLTVGPKERANRLKLAAFRAGLFPWLAPSFGLAAARQERASAPPRVERVLDALAERLDEGRPRLDVLVATRGNTSVVHTESPDWTLHVPHSPQQAVQARRHFARLGEIQAEFPALPAPEPLFGGELAGLEVFCERRLGGLSAPQLSGEHGPLARMFAELAEHLASLVRERVVVDDVVFEELLGSRFELVARFAAVPATVEWLATERARSREELIGRELPRVLHHADLRSKHVQVTADGGVLGLLDWGSSEASGLPYFDLLHLVVHERKQETGVSAGEAWRAVTRGELRDHERAPLDDYCARIGLDAAVRATFERIYPVFVGAMAERNWDYSRPRWLHRNFGV